MWVVGVVCVLVVVDVVDEFVCCVVCVGDFVWDFLCDGVWVGGCVVCGVV